MAASGAKEPPPAVEPTEKVDAGAGRAGIEQGAGVAPEARHRSHVASAARRADPERVTPAGAVAALEAQEVGARRQGAHHSQAVAAADREVDLLEWHTARLWLLRALGSGD